jgi:hypothetical protein
MMVDQHIIQKQLPDDIDKLDIHIECRYKCRSSIILQYVERYPESLARADDEGCLPLYLLLTNRESSIDLTAMMIDKYPTALQHKDPVGRLPLHIECKSQCRSIIISKCIELYPEALTVVDDEGNLPLHCLLTHESSSIDDAMLMIEEYTAALQHANLDGDLPILLECWSQSRSYIISKCIELYPEGLAKAGVDGDLPLHVVLGNKKSWIADALLVMENYPAALQHSSSRYGYLPLHIECKYRCRSSIISKCIELYPEALRKPDMQEHLPLHWLLKRASSIGDTLLMIETCPAILQYHTKLAPLPLLVECSYQCRLPVIWKCIELYPEALNGNVIIKIMKEIDMTNYREYSALLSIIFTLRPMSLYDYGFHSSIASDIRKDPCYRRRILNLLPRHVFASKHEADYRDLNWKPRAAMMMLLSHMKMKTQQQSRQQQR